VLLAESAFANSAAPVAPILLPLRLSCAKWSTAMKVAYAERTPTSAKTSVPSSPPPADTSQRVVGSECLRKLHTARFVDAFVVEIELCHCEPPRNTRPMVMRTAHAGQTDFSLPALRTAAAQMAAAGSLVSAAAAHRVPGSPNAACCRESKAPCKRGRRGRKCRPRPASAWLFGAIATDDGAAAVGADSR